MDLDRYWLLTWTTYGSWLPGDPRGSITTVRDRPGPRRRHNLPGTPAEPSMPTLHRAARAQMKGSPIYLIEDQGKALLAQFQETATIRHWLLIAVAIMRNHAHVEVGVPGDPDPEVLLRDFKAYGSRALNKRWPRPASDTWWTESGSKRKLKDEMAILGAARYIRDQEFPLVVWIHPDFAKEIGGATARRMASGG
jgi:REP element-mobilizing transposase RayT